MTNPQTPEQLAEAWLYEVRERRSRWNEELGLYECNIKVEEVYVAGFQKSRELSEAREKGLVKALKVAADQLQGIVLCLKTHGQNINVGFLIDHYEKCAEAARIEGEGDV